jgi:hypothetical protein
LMTRGMRSCKKSTVSRLISPKTSGQRFSRKYFLRGRKFLNVSVRGIENIFMSKKIIKQDMGCQYSAYFEQEIDPLYRMTYTPTQRLSLFLHRKYL